MGKKRSYHDGAKTPQTIKQLVSRNSISIREEVTGKLQTTGGNRNPKSFLRLQHLRDLANWTTKEVLIPSLGAFFGREAAAAEEVLAAPPDQNAVSCQRCETILQPGFNCSVRVQKVKEKGKPKKKASRGQKFLKNNVIYKCHYCSHFNMKPGTTQGYLQGLYPPKHLPVTTISSDVLLLDSTAEPTTPALGSGTLLLDSKKRTRKSAPKRPLSEECETIVSASQKRRKKSWTSLKEMVKSSGKETLPVPFMM